MQRRISGTWRYNLVFGLLMLVVPLLCVRVGFSMRTHRAHALRVAERQQRIERPVPGRAGSIYARAGRGYVPLAVSRQVPSCFADPLLLKDKEIWCVASRLARVLESNVLNIGQKLLSRRNRRFVWLKRNVTSTEAAAVRSLKVAAIGIQYEWRREYPSAKLARTVVGFRLRDERGGGGLELTLHRSLAARDGKRVSLTDASRRAIWEITQSSFPPSDGCHVFLTLDAVIQQFLQDAIDQSVVRFDAEWATGIVVDPSNGKVLAMCSIPTFDPSRFNEVSPDDRTNLAISTPFEPGSAFKPIIAAAAVESGVVTYDTQIDCENGVYRARRGGRISDHGHGYGVQPLEDVIVVSSNIGMAKLGELLGNDSLHTIARRFGFGETTGIELPGESGGIIRPLRKWDGYSLRRIPFGQEISVTEIQLAMGFCALVNGGVLMQPRLVDYITDPTGNVVWESSPRVVRRVLSEEVSRKTLAVLTEVVRRGTGKRCRLSSWTSFGKTGTAQIPGPEGYNDRDYCATFAGGAPAVDPKLLCVISVYRPDRSKGYYGSKVAAPYVKEVLEKALSYLNVPSDLPDVVSNGVSHFASLR